jgi:hypothetical protein
MNMERIHIKIVGANFDHISDYLEEIRPAWRNLQFPGLPILLVS